MKAKVRPKKKGMFPVRAIPGKITWGGGGGGGGGGTELFFRGTTHLTLIFLWVPPLKLKFQ